MLWTDCKSVCSVVACTPRLLQLNLIAVAPEEDVIETVVNNQPSLSLSIPSAQIPFWNPLAAAGELAPSVSQQVYQAKLLKLRPLFRLLHGNRTRLREIVGPSADISSESSDLLPTLCFPTIARRS
jgi:hypothetical protein